MSDGDHSISLEFDVHITVSNIYSIFKNMNFPRFIVMFTEVSFSSSVIYTMFLGFYVPPQQCKSSSMSDQYKHGPSFSKILRLDLMLLHIPIESSTFQLLGD